MRKPVLALTLSAAILGLTGAACATPDAGPHHGPTSRADAQARTDELFSKLDVNGDGMLDSRDREAREAEHFAMLDTDHNGALSPQEFAVAGPGRFAGKGSGPDAPLGPPPEGRGPPPMAMHGMHGMRGPGFGPGPLSAEADTNRDGAVSKAEFEAFTLAHFDEADADHDGALSKAERHAARKDRNGERGGQRGGWRDHGATGE